MRVADYIFKFLSDRGTDCVFMVSGGQAMFLVDALYQNKKIRPICTHHEQSAAMSADAYGRLTGKIGVVLATAGPGGINTINGVVGGWTDSAPMMIVSGQSPLSFVHYQEKTRIRQYGVQGINFRPLAERITKYFVTVDDPAKISYYMSKACALATTGRPGPVWIDVPLDIQKLEVPERLHEEYLPETVLFDAFLARKQAKKAIELLCEAKRPLFLFGQGIRLADAVSEMKTLISKINIPVLTSRLGIDLIPSEHRLYVGRPGIYGERAANFAIQNADLICSLGCRLSSALVGHNPKEFGRNAKKIYLDIDPEELNKPGVDIDLKVHSDAKYFIAEMIKQSGVASQCNFDAWIATCNEWKKRYPVVLSSYKDEKPVNSYYFTDKLSEIASPEEVILVDTGGCFHVAAQTWKIKAGQRFLTTGGLSSMGYWAAGIGACLANKLKNTIVITGDGSLQMNIQELATIKHNNLPIKVFIFNNNGYLLIRHTQKNFMDGRLLGESPDSGVWCPDSIKIADAYGIKGIRISCAEQAEQKIKEALEHDGPVICDVMTPEWQLLIPRVSSEKKADGTLVSKAYEDMFPYLSREELLGNILKHSGE